MIRRLLITALLVTSTAGVVMGQHRVTFLLRDGNRVIGGLTYKGGDDYTLNGHDYPSREVAVIAFIPNDPTPVEVSRIPQVDNNPTELERHVFVTRDGRMTFGKLYKFSPDGNIITFDQREGGRHDIAASNMARIYINPAAARIVYAPILAALKEPAPFGGGGGGAISGAISRSPTNARVPGGDGVTTSGTTVTVPGNQAWTATGFSVRQGDMVRFNASGEVMWSPEAADRALPGGAITQRKSGNPPVREAPGGALVGRIDAGKAFLVGNQGSVRMPASGQLFLGINDDIVGDNSGAFTVTISR